MTDLNNVHMAYWLSMAFSVGWILISYAVISFRYLFRGMSEERFVIAAACSVLIGAIIVILTVHIGVTLWD